MNPAHRPLEHLVFELSTDTDGLHTFDTQAATHTRHHAERHAAVLAEAEQVLNWARQHFPDGPGDIDAGASWCHDLHTHTEGDWVTLSLTLSGSTAFAHAFSQTFAHAIVQGDT